jgi:stage V sporulation protein R
MTGSLPSDLAEMAWEIRQHAKDFGLDFFEVSFELLDYDQLNMVAAYGGFPTRYPHWKFGMEFEELQKTYAYGLQKIYELVINNDPCYAYLMKCNNPVDQKLVMSHVYGHSDFFKSNFWFSQTNRKMMDEIANHGVRIRRYIERYGQQKVEDFLDSCLSIDNLIDYHSPFIVRHRKKASEFQDADRDSSVQPTRLKAKSYMESYINPPSYLEMERAKIQQKLDEMKKFPEEPEKDILLFLMENATLERWQRDILSIIREEAYYFAPQGMTKIMNEGWASYWHSRIMTERACTAADIIDYADHHSATMNTQPGMFNPYKLGIELFRDIEERWNKGKFGPEWEECESASAKFTWDRQLGLGRQKIFEVRKIYNDVTFIDEFLTPEFVDKNQLYTYTYNKQTQEYVIESRDFKAVKEKLLFGLSNFGQPYIYVEDGNLKNRGELYLVHRYDGVPLRLDHARDTMENIFKVWLRPVHLETVVDKRKKVLTYNGSKHEEKIIK